MRQCPTIEGDSRPLIVQCVEAGLCLARQRDFYHKCHRCVYRGKAAEFVYEPPARAEPAEGVHRNGDVPAVLLPASAGDAVAKRNGKAAPARRRAKVTGTS